MFMIMFMIMTMIMSAKLYSCVALPQACGVKPSRYEPPCRSQRRSFGTAPSLFVLRSATQSRLISFRNCWRRGVSEPLTLPVGRGGVRVDRSDAIARRWLRVHCGINVRSKIDNAADLERDWGSRIREQHAGRDVDPGALANWMLTTLEVSVPTRVCQTWLTRDWASSGKLLVCDAVEKQLGERLRLAEYKHSFADDAAAQTPSEVLL